MKRIITLVLGYLSMMLVGIAIASPADEARKAPLDASSRFWVYRNNTNGLFFVPYGYMPGEEATKMMSMSVDCAQNPHEEEVKPAGKEIAKPAVGEAKEKSTCISVKITWAAPYWCGCAFLSGPEKPMQWWGEDDRGTHYDLTELKKHRLVFWARGETGKERIQVKMGILGDKTFGDSIKIAPETKWLKLSTQWTRYELDLSKVKPEALKSICNGFTFVCSQVQQEDPSTHTTSFYLDDIYYE